MNSTDKYTTYRKERKVFALVMGILMAVLIAVAVLQISGVFAESAWEPDVEYPMTNTHITWLQTYHSGAWSD